MRVSERGEGCESVVTVKRVYGTGLGTRNRVRGGLGGLIGEYRKAGSAVTLSETSLPA